MGRLLRNIVNTFRFEHKCTDGEVKEMTIEELANHFKKDQCQALMRLNCPQCSKTLKDKSDLLDHLLNSCQKIQVTCITCSHRLEKVKFSKHSCYDEVKKALNEIDSSIQESEKVLISLL